MTGLVFFPALPLFFFTPGKNIDIPKGTEINAYINGDVPLDPEKFPAKPTNETQASSPARALAGQAFEPSTVAVKSTPDGANVAVDSKFVGITPSTLRLAPGDHTISIEKSGFKTWQRTITVSAGGNITIDPTLEKAP